MSWQALGRARLVVACQRAGSAKIMQQGRRNNPSKILTRTEKHGFFLAFPPLSISNKTYYIQ
jgi:hypothetical protein